MAKNQFLNREKSLKLPKMQFHEKKLDLFDFTSCFDWTFLIYLAHCVYPCLETYRFRNDEQKELGSFSEYLSTYASSKHM